MAEPELDGILSMDMGERVVVLPGVEEIGEALKRFKWPDYIMFIIMLLICIVIGIYFGVYRASTSAQDYLMGGRKMGVFSISMSLIASFVSGISILGIPTEIYLYGTQYLCILIGLIFMTLITNYIYLPVFCRLDSFSTHEYLERRFDKKVRVFGSVLFTLGMITWLPVVIYVPALAFNQVTGINVHVITPILCIICIFYTSLGGLKAVVWTDVIQAAIMFGAMILVAVKGTIDIGGLSVVIDRNMESGRIEGPSLDVYPSTQRYNFWSLTIGGSIYLLQVAAINQSMLQRYMSLPSIRSAKKSVWYFSLGLCAIVLACGYCGLLIYATFHKCDPLTTKLAREKDQLLPLLVMQVLGEYPGLPGIFVSGILSASLSSLSTGLNAMAAVVLEDFYPFFFTKPLTEGQCSILMKLTVIIFGAICIAFVYIIEHLGSVLQMTMSIGSITTGPSLGIFTMGVLTPWVNAKGALMGGILSLIFIGWVGIRAQISIATGDLSYPEKALTTEGCHYHFIPQQLKVISNHVNASDFMHPGEKFIFHHMSYLWYTLLGTLIAIVTGLAISLIIEPSDPRDVNPDLLAPCVAKFIRPREFPNEPGDGVIYAFEEGNKPATKVQTIEEPV